MSFRVAGAFPKTVAGVGRVKRTCTDEFRVAGAVQETCSSEMLGGRGATTTTTNANSNLLRYSTLITLHYTTCTALH